MVTGSNVRWVETMGKVAVLDHTRNGILGALAFAIAVVWPVVTRFGPECLKAFVYERLSVWLPTFRACRFSIVNGTAHVVVATSEIAATGSRRGDPKRVICVIRERFSTPLLRLLSLTAVIMASMEVTSTQGSHITSVCKGKREIAGGFRWAYFDDTDTRGAFKDAA